MPGLVMQWESLSVGILIGSDQWPILQMGSIFHQEKAPCRMILESVELCSNCEQIYSQYQYPQYSTVLKCSSKYYMILHDSTCILWPYYMSSIPIIRTYLFLTLLNFGG